MESWSFAPIHYSITPVLQHSSTPALQHSSTPALQLSSSPALQLSASPPLHAVFTRRGLLWEAFAPHMQPRGDRAALPPPMILLFVDSNAELLESRAAFLRERLPGFTVTALADARAAQAWIAGRQEGDEGGSALAPAAGKYRVDGAHFDFSSIWPPQAISAGCLRSGSGSFCRSARSRS